MKTLTMAELEKQVWEKMKKKEWTNPPKGILLSFYKDIIQCTKQVLDDNEYKKQKNL